MKKNHNKCVASIKSSYKIEGHTLAAIYIYLLSCCFVVANVSCDYKDFAVPILADLPYGLIIDSPQRQQAQLAIGEDPLNSIYALNDDSDSQQAKLAYLINPLEEITSGKNDENLGYNADPADIESPSMDQTKLIEYYGRLMRSANRIDVSKDSQYELSPPVNDPDDFNFVELSPATQTTTSGPLNLLMTHQELIHRAVAMSHNSTPANEPVQVNFEPAEVKDAGRDTDIDELDDNFLNSRYGTIKGEYIDHPLAIIGHQQVQGGAGEGRQLLGPDGSFENVQVIKTDHAVPSYCNPPNPCPLGYTAKDGCLEHFINSASFSREYQAKQQCACDNEHSLFNCGSPIMAAFKQQASGEGESRTQGGNSEQGNEITADNNGSGEQEEGTFNYIGSKLETLARAIQNRFSNMASVRDLISNHAKSIPDDDDLDASNHYTRAARKSPVVSS